MPRQTRLPSDSIAGQNGDFTISASVVAKAFGLSEPRLHEEMNAGRVLSTVERGEGSDAGRYRLTLRYQEHYFCVLIEQDGTPYQVTAPMELVTGTPVRLH